MRTLQSTATARGHGWPVSAPARVQRRRRMSFSCMARCTPRIRRAQRRVGACRDRQPRRGDGLGRAISSLKGSKTRIVDLQGRMVLPGIIDAHTHPAMSAQMLDKCNLADKALAFAEIKAADPGLPAQESGRSHALVHRGDGQSDRGCHRQHGLGRHPPATARAGGVRWPYSLAQFRGDDRRAHHPRDRGPARRQDRT